MCPVNSNQGKPKGSSFTSDIGCKIVGAVVNWVRFRPRHKNVVEATHSLETIAHVVVESREQIIIAQIGSIDVLLVEGGLRRLENKKESLRKAVQPGQIDTRLTRVVAEVGKTRMWVHDASSGVDKLLLADC